jgi:histidinol dehydrogenase
MKALASSQRSMKKIKYPATRKWLALAERPSVNTAQLSSMVQKIFDDIVENGDAAVAKYTQRFDKVSIRQTRVSAAEIKGTARELSTDLKEAMQRAAQNIRKFHSAQMEKPKVISTMKGVRCWRESRPIEKVGLYIPGGSAPLFSTVLMLGIPAQLAGCKEIALCTPPDKNGMIHPAILYAAKLAGISNIRKVGGIQAIAALTYGTKQIPRVDKIFGPGNQYVTAAKQYAQQIGVAIDLPAGPSEVLIVADQTCIPAFVAADLLSQAEHGPDSQVVLLSDDEDVLNEVLIEVDKQIEKLPRVEIAREALRHSKAILFKSIDQCMAFSNQYAPEHLILAVKNPKSRIKYIISAGSVFLGNYSCESAGDYASGTNHTLPTNGYASRYSGVSLDSFIKKITFQEITRKGIKSLGPTIECMAQAENLFAHQNAVTLRLKSL